MKDGEQHRTRAFERHGTAVYFIYGGKMELGTKQHYVLLRLKMLVASVAL